MRVLFIAPLPPPITGHALASKVFLEGLTEKHDTALVNLSAGSRGDGSITGRRIVEVLKVLWAVGRNRKGVDAVYFTISESVAGNIKDLLVYVLCIGRLSQTFIHLHGGTIRKLLFDRHVVLRKVNSIFIRRLGGVIVSGRSHEQIFAGMIDPSLVYIVPNCAQDDLFVNEEVVTGKFADIQPLKVLFISGMVEAKGYRELAHAYLALSPALQQRVRIDFAGRFDTPAEEMAFAKQIAGVPGLQYHGLVDEAQKQALFRDAHIFCLPTSLFEGQPISILEAYASGCVVVASRQDGIRDVFRHETNGFELPDQSHGSIAAVLEALMGDTQRLLPIALRNRRTAGMHYRTATYNRRLTEIIESA